MPSRLGLGLGLGLGLRNVQLSSREGGSSSNRQQQAGKPIARQVSQSVRQTWLGIKQPLRNLVSKRVNNFFFSYFLHSQLVSPHIWPSGPPVDANEWVPERVRVRILMVAYLQIALRVFVSVVGSRRCNIVCCHSILGITAQWGTE